MSEIWLAIKEWIIYKFSIDDYNPIREEIDHLKMMIDRERDERIRLQELLISPLFSKESNEKELELPQPIVNKKFIPWHVRREGLEKEDRDRARNLDDEAKIALNKNKTTEQLEHEILVGD